MNKDELFIELKKRINSINDNYVKVISIIGGAGRGKTTLANELIAFLGNACTLSTDACLIGDRAYRHQYLEGKDPLKKYNPDVLNQIISQIIKR